MISRFSSGGRRLSYATCKAPGSPLSLRKRHLVEAAVVRGRWRDVGTALGRHSGGINVQADVLDKVYLEHEARKLNLSDFLKKAFTEAQG